MQQAQIIGAIKIKDALFIGDEFASSDFEFILTNKVTHIINCAGKQIENQFAHVGVKYLTFDWVESDSEVLFDEEDQNLNAIYDFMEECSDMGESCLVHSVRGQSRSCCVLAAYFMKKYSWTLYKTLEFLNSRRPDLEIRASFFYQLNSLEAKIGKNIPLSSASWNELTDTSTNQDELIIRNTYLNSHNNAVDEIYTDLNTKNNVMNKQIGSKLKWKDQHQLATIVYNGPSDYLPVVNYITGNTALSILKGKNPKQPSLNSTAQTSQQLRSISSKSLGEHNDLTQGTSLISSNPSLNNLLGPQKTQNQKSPSPVGPQIQLLQTNSISKKSIKQCPKPPLQTQNLAQVKQRPNQNDSPETNIYKNNSYQNLQNPNDKLVLQNNSFQVQKGSSLLSDSPVSQQQLVKIPQSSQVQLNLNQQQNEFIPKSFQEFKNQVQQSLSYFQKKETKIDKSQEPLSDQLRLSFKPASSKAEIASNLLKQLDTLITTTKQGMNTSSSYSVLSKVQQPWDSSFQPQPVNNSLQQIKENPNPNSLKISSSQTQIKQQEQIMIDQKDNKNLIASTVRSTSAPKQIQDDQKQIQQQKRPNSADLDKAPDFKPPQYRSPEIKSQIVNKSQDTRLQLNNTTGKKAPSPTNVKLKKTLPPQYQGLPLPSSQSQIYLRNVQSRRQASSILRNSRPVNSTFQERYINSTVVNQSQNSSSQQILNYSHQQQNSYLFNDSSPLMERPKYDLTKLTFGLDKQIEQFSNNRTTMIKQFQNVLDSKTELNFSNLQKKQTSPQVSGLNTTLSNFLQIQSSKSQTNFPKNQPIKAIQELNEKITQQILSKQSRPKDMKEKFNNSLTNFSVTIPKHNVPHQPRQFSPGPGISTHLTQGVNNKLSIQQSLKQKIRNPSPASMLKENDTSNMSNSYIQQNKVKTMWKIC